MLKVFIRPLQAEDYRISYKWRNDPDIWKYTGSHPDVLITPELEKEWLHKVIKLHNQIRFAICVNDDHEYIGNIQLTDIKDRKAQYHIFIGEKKYWGKGIATQATKLLLEYGVKKAKLSEIYLYVQKNNIAAIRLYIKCGFTYKIEDEQQIMMIYKHG
jgi:RimJ/RimL family protein N-acetyltransferase